MTTPLPPDNSNSTQISAETVQALRDFVRAAVPRLTDELKDQTPEWDVESRWECGTDGNFRELTKRTRKLPVLNEQWFNSIAEYDTCIEKLKSDPVIGTHVDRLVGTNRSSFRFEPNRVLLSLFYAMFNDEGALAFTDERFDYGLRDWVDFIGADRVASKMVAPLPGLVLPTFPLRLNDELVLDRLTDDEVTNCCQVGILQPTVPQFPLIQRDVAVGIRRTMFSPKVVQSGEEAEQASEVEEVDTFGCRPHLRDDLAIDDVLTAFRLFKNTRISTAGFASWVGSGVSQGGISYRVLRQWPYFGKFELSEEEVPQFLELWHLLEKWSSLFSFSIHRFNLSFEPRIIADRIVDLIIAAESLFLNDVDEQYRGELSFRCALRAAKFIEHPDYNKRELFKVMRRAYKGRSAIVHGGSLKDSKLPDNQSANTTTFIDAIEEIMRLGLNKALSMKNDGKHLREAEYWEDLLFSTPL